MAVDRRLPWLGAFPVAVDLANTVIDSPRGSIDLLESDDDLARWIAVERAQLPSADAAAGHLSEVRALRDAVRETLFAASADRPLPRDALEHVNRAAAAAPSHPRLNPDGSVELVTRGGSDFGRFAAAVAHTLVGVVGGPDRGRLSVCGAPSCGMFFLRDDPRQRWCTPSCGNRARVARHALRRSSRTARPRRA